MLRFTGDFNLLARFGFFMHRNPVTGRQRLIWCNNERFDEDDEDDCVAVEPDGTMSFGYWDAEAVAVLIYDLTASGLIRKI